MRKTINFLVALLIVIGAASTTATFAAGDLETKGKKIKLFSAGKQVKLVYLSSEALNVEISIENAEGELLYNEVTLSEKGFLLPFDMSQLPLGEYTFHIKEGESDFVQSVQTEASVTEGSMLTMIKGLEKKAVVVTSADEIPADLDLVIYGENGQIIYKETLDSQKLVKNMYNLEQIESDEVRIVIKEGSEILKESKFIF